MRTTVDRRHLPHLAQTVWAERHLAEHLLYKLVSATLVLAADDRRFTGLAIEEVERIVQRLWHAEHARSVAVTEVADDWGIPPRDITLSSLAETSPEPWGSMFEEHRLAFVRVTEEIARTADGDARLSSVALHDIRTSLAALAGTPTPVADGAPGSYLAPRARVGLVL